MIFIIIAYLVLKYTVGQPTGSKNPQKKTRMERNYRVAIWAVRRNQNRRRQAIRLYN